jgi:hypothetical protein
MFGSLIIGIFVAACFALLLNYVMKQNIVINWWQWALTGLGFIYVIFVLETIQAFLNEGTGQGAFVTGLVLGIIAIIWAALLARFVFVKK